MRSKLYKLWKFVNPFEVNVPFVWDEKYEFFRYFQSFQKANIGLKLVGIIVSG